MNLALLLCCGLVSPAERGICVCLYPLPDETGRCVGCSGATPLATSLVPDNLTAEVSDVTPLGAAR